MSNPARQVADHDVAMTVYAVQYRKDGINEVLELLVNKADAERQVDELGGRGLHVKALSVHGSMTRIERMRAVGLLDDAPVASG